MSTNDADLSPELADRVARELTPDEKLIWAGQPRPDLMARAAWFLVPFGLVFAGFAVFWMIMAGVMTGGLMAPCALPFIAIGLGMVASPVWLRSLARKTLYALTDRRALVWEPSFWGTTTLRQYTAAGLGHLTRVERSDGSGDLVFEEFTTVNRSGNGTSTSTTRRGFLAIDRVHEVEHLIRQTLLTG